MTENTSGQRPAASAAKADLVEYAVTQGFDRGEAEGMTKDDLNARLDQRDAQLQASQPDQGQPGQPQV